jgi:tyrosyl-tRNA synthetase
MNLSEELQTRGFINQFSAESLSLILDKEKRVIYHGIDPSADSAHAGNFVIWMLLRHLINDGHKVVFLVGGGTGMIGDPKPDAERTLRVSEDVKNNVDKLKIQAEKLLNNNSVEFVNNYDWLSQLGLIPFLRDIGKHFTVNELIKKEAISKRLSSETGLSYTEFAYPLLQAYDYLKLYRDKNCTLQVGGSDQWGNMIAGVELVRKVERESVHVITVPLIVDKVTGKKFGKSEGNAVWLDAEKTSPYAFYQFWFNVDDESVIDYLKLFTLLPLGEISEIEKNTTDNPGKREAQKILAKEVTSLVHGEGVCEQVEKVTTTLFGETLVKDLSSEEIEVLKENAPLSSVADNTPLVDVLVESGLASSKREARTFVEGGAVLVQGEKVVDVGYVLTKQADGGLVYLKRGKKSISLVELG